MRDISFMVVDVLKIARWMFGDAGVLETRRRQFIGSEETLCSEALILLYKSCVTGRSTMLDRTRITRCASSHFAKGTYAMMQSHRAANSYGMVADVRGRLA